MTNVALEQVDVEIRKRRTQVIALQAELEELGDYLDVLEARKKSMGRKTLSQADMERRYAAKSAT
jgi:hypothetical protein